MTRRFWKSFLLLLAVSGPAYAAPKPEDVTVCPRTLALAIREVGTEFTHDNRVSYLERNRLAREIALDIRGVVGARFAGPLHPLRRGKSRRVAAADFRMSDEDKAFLVSRLSNLPVSIEQGIALKVWTATDVSRMLEEVIVLRAKQESDRRNGLAIKVFGVSIYGTIAAASILGLGTGALLNPDSPNIKPLIDEYTKLFPNAPIGLPAALTGFGASGWGVSLVASVVSILSRENDETFSAFFAEVKDVQQGVWSYSFNYKGAEGDIIVYGEPYHDATYPHLLLILREPRK